jgi:hypothetical protein
LNVRVKWGLIPFFVHTAWTLEGDTPT